MRRIVLICFCLALLAGCGDAGVPEDTLPTTAAAAPPASIEATAAPATAMPATSAPATPAPVLVDSAVIAIVDPLSHFLLGGYQSGTWLSPQDAAPLLTTSLQYAIYPDQTSAPIMVLGQPPVQNDVPCGSSYDVTLEPDDTRFDTALIAISGAWNVFPRLVEPLANDQPDYQTAVREILDAQGLTDSSVMINRILRADLNNDGIDEVIISAANFGTDSISPDAAAGDYAFVAVRTIVNGKVQTILTESNFYPTAEQFIAPGYFFLDGVADVNGDGTLELLISSGYYEGSSKAVYSFDGIQTELVIGSGCGV